MQGQRSSPFGEPGGRRSSWSSERGVDVSIFEKALDQAVGEKAEVKSLVSKRSLQVRDLDDTVTREEVVAALCIAGQARPRGPVQAVQTLWWCADCGCPFNRGGRPELARAQ